MRLGIIPGTFNPPTVAHLALAGAAAGIYTTKPAWLGAVVQAKPTDGKAGKKPDKEKECWPHLLKAWGAKYHLGHLYYFSHHSWGQLFYP